MAYQSDCTYHASSALVKGGWAALLVSWFAKRNERKVEKIRLKKLLSYSDHTLKDIGLSRSKIIEKHGSDPHDGQRMYAAFTFPHLYLSNNSVITKNHTKHRR